MSRRHSRPIRLLAGVTLVVMSACSGHSTSTFVVARAYRGLVGGGTSHVTMTQETRAVGGVPPVVATEVSSFDYVRHLGRIDPTNGTLGGEVLVVGSARYHRAGSATQPWVVEPVHTPSSPAEQAMADLLQPVDPSRLLYVLQGLANPVTTVGAEPVGSVHARHYRLGVDVRLVSQLESNLTIRTGIEDAIRGFLVSPVLPGDLWVDSAGRPVQLRLTFEFAPTIPTQTDPAVGGASPFTAPPGAGGGIYIVTYSFSDFGLPVNVVVPAHDQVVIPPATTTTTTGP